MAPFATEPALSLDSRNGAALSESWYHLKTLVELRSSPLLTGRHSLESGNLLDLSTLWTLPHRRLHYEQLQAMPELAGLYTISHKALCA